MMLTRFVFILDFNDDVMYSLKFQIWCFVIPFKILIMGFEIISDDNDDYDE